MSATTVTPELLWAPKARGRITGIVWTAIIVSLITSVAGIVVVAVSAVNDMIAGINKIASLGDKVASPEAITVTANLFALGTQLLIAGLVIALVAGITTLIGTVADRRHTVTIPTLDTLTPASA